MLNLFRNTRPVYHCRHFNIQNKHFRSGKSRRKCETNIQLKECDVWVGNTLSWVISVKRALRQLELGEYDSLLCLLANVILCWDSSHRRLWKSNPAWSFSSRFFPREILIYRVQFGPQVHQFGWDFLPLRVEVFLLVGSEGQDLSSG